MQTVTNWIASGWLNVCHSINLSSGASEKSGLR